jgi:hypothetical protein
MNNSAMSHGQCVMSQAFKDSLRRLLHSLPIAPFLIFSVLPAGADSIIYYTTDGSQPTHNSPVYSGAISVPTSMTLNAICSASGYSDSPVGTANYIINGNGLIVWDLHLPSTIPLGQLSLPQLTGVSVSYIAWTFTPRSNDGSSRSGSSKLKSQSGAGSSGGAHSFQTTGYTANLAVQGLLVGDYTFSAIAYNSAGIPVAQGQATITLVLGDLSGVTVYPNPWRSDKSALKQITFAGLTSNSTVKIFTVSGHWVKTLPKSDSQVTWDLMTDSGKSAASGIYLYLITTGSGEKQQGKLAIIR